MRGSLGGILRKVLAQEWGISSERSNATLVPPNKTLKARSKKIKLFPSNQSYLVTNIKNIYMKAKNPAPKGVKFIVSINRSINLSKQR